MNAQTIKNKLDALSKLQEQVKNANDNLTERLVAEYGTGVLSVIVDWRANTTALSQVVATLDAEVKEAVLELNETVSGTDLQAIPCKGKTSWDGKGLTGYAVAHPEINAFKKTGNPYVMIKAKE
jgi:gas vesicle protein